MVDVACLYTILIADLFEFMQPLKNNMVLCIPSVDFLNGLLPDEILWMPFQKAAGPILTNYRWGPIILMSTP